MSDAVQVPENQVVEFPEDSETEARRRLVEASKEVLDSSSDA